MEVEATLPGESADLQAINANAVMPMALTGMNEGGPPPYSPEDLLDVMDSLRPLAPHLTVENVAPLVVYLASSRCRENHRIFSVGAGHEGVHRGNARLVRARAPDSVSRGGRGRTHGSVQPR